MIIYALVFIAILFFLSWNLIDSRKAHFVTSVVTTGLFLIAVAFSIANFKNHYGMHRVSEPKTVRSIQSVTPQKNLKMIVYQPMGSHKGSQLVIYRNSSKRMVHTDPDIKVTNRIVRNNHVKWPHVITKNFSWQYRSRLAKDWFNVANKPKSYKVQHVFYVPNSWHILSAKQSRAIKQILINKGRQMKAKLNTPAGKQQAKQQVTVYVKGELGKAMQKNPKLSQVEKKRITKKAVQQFKSQEKQKAEAKLIPEALRTVKSIH